jgi:hypothetical protein
MWQMEAKKAEQWHSKGQQVEGEYYYSTQGPGGCQMMKEKELLSNLSTVTQGQ